ncbi:class II glutamine amidotransferase [Rhodoblastus sp.]|uniref:class II glutamine amidotransferase n=1 Tax=Rhodoblastus sp. TaxID=1962975 RepID=UPI003F983CD0
MCELFGFSSLSPTRATFSLRTFAERGGFTSDAADGWGLAFLEGRDARLYKEPAPAADSSWLHFIEERRIPTCLMISHIRRATRGAKTHANTQPFQRELGGRAHVFAHNGVLDGIDRNFAGAARRFQPMGETDSEIAFCILLERMAPLWARGATPDLEKRRAVFADFASDMRALGPANFLYCDGDALFAHGHRRTRSDGAVAPPGLWRLERRCEPDRDAAESAEGARQHIVLFASVPLSGEDWSPLAEGETIVVKDGHALIPEGAPSRQP